MTRPLPKLVERPGLLDGAGGVGEGGEPLHQLEALRRRTPPQHLPGQDAASKVKSTESAMLAEVVNLRGSYIGRARGEVRAPPWGRSTSWPPRGARL